jgi:hypothetical protein
MHPVGTGTFPVIREIQVEIDEMVAVLLGRKDAPHDNGVMTMMEVANSYYARAQELTLMIQRAEAEGVVLPKSKHYRLRTGELRTFTELALRCAELGSRRVTLAQLEWESQHG